MHFRKKHPFLLFTIFLSFTVFMLLGSFQLFEDRDPQYTDQFDPYFMASMGLEALSAPIPFYQDVLQALGIDKSIPCDVAALIVAQAAPELGCHTVCTNNKAKPCGGYSSCYGKDISCSSAGKDQDGRNCNGCCFSCDVVCDPPPNPDVPPTFTLEELSCSRDGLSGWCVGTATLNLTATESKGRNILISGDVAGNPFSCPSQSSPASCPVPLPDGNGTINYTALSDIGLSTNSSKAWKLDSISPTINGSLNGTIGENGWFVSSVVFSASASDATSGLNTFETSLDGAIWTPYTSPLTFTDGSYTLQVRAVDVAGNVELLNQSIPIDSVSPLLDRSITGTAGANGWYVSDVTVEATASDPAPSSGFNIQVTTDGANWIGYTTPLTLTEGTYNLQLEAKDIAGNSVLTADYINVDTTPPALSGSLSGTLGSANWYTSAVQASVTVSDSTSGIAYTEYSPDSGAWRVYSTPVNFSDGQHSIQFRTTDIAGLQTDSEIFTFQVDTQGPEIHLPSRWYIWESSEFIVKDAHSKVVAVSYEIRDGQNRWKKVEHSWTPDTHEFTRTISWNRIFADGIRAPIGSYRVRVYAEDAAGNVRHKDAEIIIPAPNATALPTLTPTATPTNSPTPTEEVFEPPVLPQATATPTPTPQDEDEKDSGVIIFGSEPTENTDSNPNSPILWGAAAAAAIGTFQVAIEEKKRREAQKRASHREKAARKAAEKAGRLDEYIRERRKAKEAAIKAEAERILQKDNKKRATKKREQSGCEKEWKAKEAQQAIWDANGAAIYAANQGFKEAYGKEMDAGTREQAIKDATVNGVFNAGAYATNLNNARLLADYRAAQERIREATNEIENEKKIEEQDDSYIPPQVDWKQQDYNNLAHAEEIAEASRQEKRSWWEKTVDWVDNHQAEVSLGLGVAAAVAAIIISGGMAVPLVLAAAGTLTVAGAAVSIGTMTLNAHYGRDISTNVFRNLAITGITTVVLTGVWAMFSGAAQAIGGYCSAKPEVCANIEPVLNAVDTVEEWWLHGKLQYQIWAGDKIGAIETRTEIEFEHQDGGMPGNTVMKEVGGEVVDLAIEYGDDVVELAGKYGDDAVDIIRTYGDDAFDMLAEHGSAARFLNAGEEVIPDILKSFGDKTPGYYGDNIISTVADEAAVLGRLEPDIKAARELGMYTLDDPDWTQARNFKWLQDGIDNGDIFYIGSKIEEDNLLSSDPDYAVTILTKELDMLLQNGYVRVGDYLVPGP